MRPVSNPQTDPPFDPLSDPAELAWLRRLAGSLVRSDADADDLAQETWLRLRLTPRGPRSGFRPWARQALENLIQRRFDSAERRARRERRVASGEVSDSPHAAAETLDLHRELLAAVDSLPPDLGEVITLRYLEGLPPREIANRTGLRARNVETRLRRGLETLRLRLDRRYEDRGAWVAMWLPLTGRRLAAPSVLPFGIAMSFKTLALASVFAGALLSWFYFGRSAADADSEHDACASRRSELETQLADSPLSPIESSPEAPQLGSRVTATDERSLSPDGAKLRRSIRAHVIDPSRRPIPGLPLRVVPADAELRGWVTDDSGDIHIAFECRTLTWPDNMEPGPNRRGNPQLIDDDEAWTTVFAGRVIADFPGDSECTIGVARTHSLTVRVTTTDGSPVPDAVIDIEPARAAAALFGVTGTSSVPRRWRALPLAGGTYEVLDVAMDVPLRVRASASGQRSATIEQAFEPGVPLEIVLDPEEARFEITGRVQDPDGTPNSRAIVLHGRGRVACDENGEFILNGHRSDLPQRLIAIAPGRRPGEAVPEHDAEGRAAWRDPVELRLGQRARAIEGVLYDVDDQPVAGATVWIENPTVHDGEGRGLASLEPIIAGQRGTTVRTQSDEEGRFRLEGLLERAYDVHAVDPRSLALATSSEVRAGTATATLRFQRANRIEDLAGRTVDRTGVPFPNVGLRLARTTNRMGAYEDTAWGAETTSDDQGRFRFASIAADGLEVRVSGEGVFGTRLPLEGLRSGATQRIVVPRRCRMRVEIDTAGENDCDAWALDVPLLDEQFVHAPHRFRGPLHEGVSTTVSVPDTARALLLLRGSDVIRRIPVSLRSGVLNVIR